MTTFLWALGAMLSTAVVGLATMIVLSPPAESSFTGPIQHEGRPVRYWIADLRLDGSEAQLEAAQAMSRMGPGNRDAVPILIDSLEDQHRVVRIYSTRALGQIGPDAHDALPALGDALAKARDRELLENIAARRKIEGR